MLQCKHANWVRYYAVIFLNQLHLSKDDADLAERLINLYFSVFEKQVAAGEVESRLLDALLKGMYLFYIGEKDRNQ